MRSKRGSNPKKAPGSVIRDEILEEEPVQSNIQFPKILTPIESAFDVYRIDIENIRGRVKTHRNAYREVGIIDSTVDKFFTDTRKELKSRANAIKNNRSISSSVDSIRADCTRTKEYIANHKDVTFSWIDSVSTFFGIKTLTSKIRSWFLPAKTREQLEFVNPYQFANDIKDKLIDAENRLNTSIDKVIRQRNIPNNHSLVLEGGTHQAVTHKMKTAPQPQQTAAKKSEPKSKQTVTVNPAVAPATSSPTVPSYVVPEGQKEKSLRRGKAGGYIMAPTPRSQPT